MNDIVSRVRTMVELQPAFGVKAFQLAIDLLKAEPHLNQLNPIASSMWNQVSYIEIDPELLDIQYSHGGAITLGEGSGLQLKNTFHGNPPYGPALLEACRQGLAAMMEPGAVLNALMGARSIALERFNARTDEAVLYLGFHG